MKNFIGKFEQFTGVHLHSSSYDPGKVDGWYYRYVTGEQNILTEKEVEMDRLIQFLKENPKLNVVLNYHKH